MKRVLLLLSIIFVIALLYKDVNAASGLPVPRFVSLRSNEVNVRTGPGTRYPLSFVYTKKDLPVEITEEYENWRFIKDNTGRTGWIHTQMLSGKRTIRFIEDASMYRAAFENSVKIALVKKGNIGTVTMCPEGSKMCKVNLKDYTGWVDRDTLWGLYPQEHFD
ncbi:MAG: hypothetical protein MJ247_05010 [Alphaproteobacteria bacterium]|nr:hypothetical protein [Alphaproteobacteria bacterium]